MPILQMVEMRVQGRGYSVAARSPGTKLLKPESLGGISSTDGVKDRRRDFTSIRTSFTTELGNGQDSGMYAIVTVLKGMKESPDGRDNVFVHTMIIPEPEYRERKYDPSPLLKLTDELYRIREDLMVGKVKELEEPKIPEGDGQVSCGEGKELAMIWAYSVLNGNVGGTAETSCEPHQALLAMIRALPLNLRLSNFASISEAEESPNPANRSSTFYVMKGRPARAPSSNVLDPVAEVLDQLRRAKREELEMEVSPTGHLDVDLKYWAYISQWNAKVRDPRLRRYILENSPPDDLSKWIEGVGLDEKEISRALSAYLTRGRTRSPLPPREDKCSALARSLNSLSGKLSHELGRALEENCPRILSSLSPKLKVELGLRAETSELSEPDLALEALRDPENGKRAIQALFQDVERLLESKVFQSGSFPFGRRSAPTDLEVKEFVKEAIVLDGKVFAFGERLRELGEVGRDRRDLFSKVKGERDKYLSKLYELVHERRGVCSDVLKDVKRSDGKDDLYYHVVELLCEHLPSRGRKFREALLELHKELVEFD
ncbi:hypothetical protein [Sulfodiicoccus acidiphilus]|uniref:hypothetical protein n=1 Tax=Sulfodiicoccus acidiphilus TaxID=1670455 RepID=UPI000F8190BA|nr:hypothetical protein [Sulfodiicoccus acidiphilus]